MKFIYLLISFLIISCECADEFNTDRVHIPSEFANISVINFSTGAIDLEYNNIGLGNFEPLSALNEYNRIESGNPILSISAQGQGVGLYSIPLSLEEGKYYTALIFNFSRYRILIFGDDYSLISGEDFIIRIINLGTEGIVYNFSNNSNTLTEFESEEITASPSSILEINGESIDLSRLSPGRVYNFILDSNKDIFLSQSYRK